MLAIRARTFVPFYSHPLTARHINRVNPGYQMTSCPLFPDSPADVLHANAHAYASCFFDFDFEFDSRSYPLCWDCTGFDSTDHLLLLRSDTRQFGSCSYAVAVLRSGD